MQVGGNFLFLVNSSSVIGFIMFNLLLPHELKMILIFNSISSSLGGCGGDQKSCSPLNALFCFLKG